ncbi:MAG: hypothetical protein P1V51_11445 [Deltaproteobacteria bacterium]|nr:hypothetical protein [Deltaproteobacteria bacterium]
MSESKNGAHEELAVYPNGIEEKPGGNVQLFLKLTYIGFVIFGITYFILYMSGDGSELVQQLNQATGHASP